MERGWWMKERKSHRHEFRTTKSEEEVINRLLEKRGGTTSKLVLDALRDMDKKAREDDIYD